MNGLVKQKKPISPLAAGLTGIVIGAAGATALALQDEDVRRKANKKAHQMKSDLKKWGSDKIHDMRQRRDETRKEIQDTKDDVAKQIKDMEL
jgi:gas vesicle protein